MRFFDLHEHYKTSLTDDCLSLDSQFYPLKVFTSDLDGVVRNVAFTNIASDTTIQSPCTEEKVQAALFLSTDRETNVPMVLGLDGESLKYFFRGLHNFALSTQHIISDLAKLLVIFGLNSQNFINVLRIC